MFIASMITGTKIQMNGYSVWYKCSWQIK